MFLRFCSPAWPVIRRAAWRLALMVSAASWPRPSPRSTTPAVDLLLDGDDPGDIEPDDMREFEDYAATVLRHRK